jgi:sirohydrochlorin cobaltochelatase
VKDTRMIDEARNAQEQLDARLKTLLPPEYRESYEDMQPVPMGSAGMRYQVDGKVAWDAMWGSFCDLAMAGGPPHKGALLEPGTEAAINADFARYDEVVEEICRGIRMVSGLRAYPSPTPGWVSVTCHSDTMAGWLVRAIAMENVSVHLAGAVIELPASPDFRIDKEVKNVVTVIAKTCHYWLGHMPREQQRAIGDLFSTMTGESPLLEPDWSDGDTGSNRELAGRISARIQQETGLGCSDPPQAGWLGVECPSVRSAVWMMRAMVAHNVLSRREGHVLFVPINRSLDPRGALAASAVARVHRHACASGVC